MPTISNEQLAQLEEAGRQRRGTVINQNMEAAGQVDPNTAVEKIGLQEEFNVPFDTVQRNTDLLMGMRKKNTVDIEGLTQNSPGTARYLESRNNALVSSDDTKTLSELEAAVTANVPFWGNNTRLFADRLNSLSGNLLATVGTGVQALEQYAIDRGDRPAPGPGEMSPGQKLADMGNFIADSNVYGGVSNFSWENFKGDMTPTNLAGYIVEQGLFASGPDMFAAVAALPLYVASRSNELAKERAINNGDPDVDIKDIAAMLPLSVAISLSERLGAKAALGWDKSAVVRTGAKQVAAVVGRAAAIEGGTEFFQEGAEYLGTTLGTKKPVSALELLDRSIAGLVAGAGVGAGVRTPGAVYEDAILRRNSQRVVRRHNSEVEQTNLDDIITLSQASRTNERSKAQAEEFVQGLTDNDVVYLDREGAQKLLEGDAMVPEPLRSKILDGGDTDIEIPMSEFVTGLATDKEAMGLIRPHLSRTLRSLTPAQMDSQNNAEMENLVKEAAKHEELSQEAKTVFKSVKDKLTQSGIYSKEEAGYMAALYPAVATVIAQERGISVTDAYKRMGLEVLNTDVTPVNDTDPNVLPQAQSQGYQGTVPSEAQSWLDGIAKFGEEGMTTEARMARAAEQGYGGQVLYRGLTQPYEEGASPAIVWASPDQQYADSYAEPNTIADPGGNNVVPMVARVERPYDLGYRSDRTEVKFSDVLDRIAVGVNNAFGLGTIDRETGARLLLEIEKMQEEDTGAYQPVFKWWNSRPEVKQILQDAGYDALEAREQGGSVKTIGVFDPNQLRSVNATFDPDATESENLLSQSAYHGTPHKFDKFSLDAIGTGEGAQAYGWGLYFAGQREIAEYYRDSVSNDFFQVADGELFDPSKLQHLNVKVLATRGELDAAIAKATEVAATDSPAAPLARADLAVLQDVKDRGGMAKPEGALYAVDIPENTDLLIWDVPLRKQPKAVQAALVKMGPDSLSEKRKKEGWGSALNLIGGPTATGADLMKALEKELGSQEAASRYLDSLGVPGLRYFDAPSRNRPFQEVRNEFLEMLDQDASVEDVMGMISSGEFSQASADFLKALDAEDWLGFDYPAQAISGALSQNAAGKFDLSDQMVDAIAAIMGEEGTYNYVIWDADQVTVEAVNDELLQAQDEGLAQDDRATIQLLQDKRVIRMSKASDLSSFLHESAHLFLDVEKSLAAEFGITPRQQKILDWLGAESFDQLTAGTPEGVAMHEKFAEGFETYLYEGKAPSLALRDAFAAFARWLRQIYRAIAPYTALDDDARQVFDAMLATEAQIEAALASGIYEQMFSSQEQAGMTDAEWTRYQLAVQRRKDRAQETLDERVLRQLRARRTKEWRQERKPLLEEAKARLAELPIYQLMKATLEFRMDTAAVKEILGENVPSKLKTRVMQEGTDPALYAEQFEFASAEEMIKELMAAPSLEAAATAEAEAIMIETHGDILNDGSIEAEARSAVENDTHAQLLYDEAAALARKARRPKINREMLKAQAALAISKMNTTQVKPTKFYQAEIRAAVRAATETDPVKKLAAQTQRLANHYLFVEATKAQKNAIKYQAYLRAAQKRAYDPRVVDPGYINALKQLVNLYDFRAKPKKRRERARKLYEWYKGQAEAGVILMDNNLALYAESINAGVSEDYVFPTMNELTMEDLRSTYDMARHLRFRGGKVAVQASEQVRIEREELVAETVRTGKKYIPTPDQPDLEAEKKASWFFLANLLPSLRNMIRNLDGFSKDGDGAWARLIYSKVSEGTSRRLELAKEFYGNFAKELETISDLGIYRDKGTVRTIQKEEGGSLTLDRMGRFMLAAYWGTESSREAIRKGHGVTDNDVQRMLSLMTPAELEAVNGLWKANETMWPKLSEAALKRDGVAPPKLTPTPFQINGVELTGGHMRIIYETHVDEVRTDDTRLDYVNSIVPGKAASAMARVGSGGKKVRLDPNNIYRAIDDNVHFIAFGEIGTQLQALVNAKEVQAAILATRGSGFQRAFAQNITGLVTNAKERETIPAIAKLANLSRHARSAMYLAYNLKNILQQVGSLPQALDEVGVIDFTSATARMMYNPLKFMGEIHTLSSQMRDRAEKLSREHAEVTKRQLFNSKTQQVYNTFVRHGFTPHIIMDMAISYPVWYAKYNQEMLAHGDQKRAVTSADVAVAESVGSGLDLYMGKGLQSNQAAMTKLFTVFGSWFNTTTFQRAYRDTKGFTEFSTSRAFMSLALIPVFSAVVAAAAAADLPDFESGEPSEFWKWLALRYTSFAAGTLPLIRDANGALTQGFTPQTPLMSLLEAPKGAYDMAKAMAEGELTPAKTASNTLKVVGGVAPIPGSGNVVRMLDYIDSYQQGNEPDRSIPGHLFHGFVEGPDKNRVK